MRQSRPQAGTLPTALLILVVLKVGCAAAPPVAPAPATAAHPPGDGGAALRLMTFNIRFGTAPDGADSWSHRRELAVEVIRSVNPAVLGLQEALRFQLDELEEALPQFGELGVGRDDGLRAGEYAAILYDRHRLAVVEHGNFWLSDTPAVPGSMTWGNRYPRIVSWARLADRAAATTFYVFNSHWDHESQPARQRGATLLVQRIRTRTVPEDPLLLLGDFNSSEDNPAFRTLLAIPVVDTFRVVHPAAQDVGTFHAFRGQKGGASGAKIDALLASPHWHVLDAAIVYDNDSGRYPSDHFPVTATVALPAKH